MRPPEFWYPKNGRMTITAFFLAPVSWVFHFLGWLRRLVVRPTAVDVPVICVGNLTAGGTGKTPLCLAIGKVLVDAGRTPHFLTRGYGGQEKGPLQVDVKRHTAAQVGDEALLLAQGAPTWVSRDRLAGAKAAAEAGADTIIMDDGFQNPHLKKSFSFIVIDSVLGFGNGLVHPAGPLREFAKAGLSRADAVMITGANSTLPPPAQALVDEKGLPTFTAKTRIGDIENRQAEAAVVAFSGIGRPEKFFQSLREQDIEIREAVPYPDHHAYSLKDLNWLSLLASEKQAGLITTSKDFVRIPEAYREKVSVLPIHFELEQSAVLLALVEERLASA